MKADEIRVLCDYNYWATERILAAASLLGPGRFAAPGTLSHGGLRGTLVHALSAEWVWRLRVEEGRSPTSMLAEGDFPTVEALRERWQREEQAMRAYLDRLTDKNLEQTVRYRRASGAVMENTLWHLLVHLVNHGTQHRSEAAVLLTDLGHSPGDLDFTIYLQMKS